MPRLTGTLGLPTIKWSEFWKTGTFETMLQSLQFQRTPANIRLRRLAKKTFIGSCCTLASSITSVISGLPTKDHELTRRDFRNLTVLMALNGEESWLCLMCCNSDSKPKFFPNFLSVILIYYCLFSPLLRNCNALAHLFE